MTDEPHRESGARFVYALVALLVLTALSFAMHFVPLGGALGAVVALAIAAIKVAVVAIVFMELGRSYSGIRTVAIASVLFVALLCFGVIGDVAFR